MNMLKKSISIVLCIVMLVSMATIISAKEYASEGNQFATAYKCAPTVDGVINSDEGWGTQVYLNEQTGTRAWAGNPMMASANIHFAYTDDGVYFACDVTEITTGTWTNGATGEEQEYTKVSESYPDAIIESTYVNTNEGEAVAYGFNGDTVCFTIDPLGMLEQSDFINLTRYNISLLNGKAEVYRTVFNQGFITEQVEAACVMDHENNKMTVECYIPWSIICEDLETETFGAYTATPEEMAASDAESRAMITYMDRFMDPEQEDVETFSRYMTVCQRTWDGRPTVMDSAFVTRDYGIIIQNGGCPHINTTNTPIQVESHTQKGYYNVHCEDCDTDLDVVSVPRLSNPNPFTDVGSGKWYTTAIADCYAAGYMYGVGDGTIFSPNEVMTRAMAVQVLAKICKADLSEYENKQIFNDVQAGKWYTGAVNWAYENGITSGMSATEFAPKGELTREQLCVLLYNVAQFLGCDVSFDSSVLNDFTDRDTIHSWAKDAMGWACDVGLVSGVGGGKVSPRTMATRAQISLILINFDDNYITCPVVE